MTNKIAIKRYDISAMAIFDGDKVDVMTEDSATKSIDIVGMAKERVSRVRSYYGAIQNRLEHTIKNLDNVVENTTAAESQIRDTDMASTMVEYTKNNILMQAGQSMLAQANQSTQGVMSLLQ
jgi:flagellin